MYRERRGSPLWVDLRLLVPPHLNEGAMLTRMRHPCNRLIVPIASISIYIKRKVQNCCGRVDLNVDVMIISLKMRYDGPNNLYGIRLALNIRVD